MRGVILINTGSPASPSPKEVGRYLSQFLMDERVIDIPLIPRFMLVRGIIVPFRKYKSAKSYGAIWTNEGSPLQVNSVKLALKVEQISGMVTEVAMRFGSSTVESALARLKSRVDNLSEVVVVPMFPHYAMSSYESAALFAQHELQRLDGHLSIRVVKPFYNHSSYISSLVSLFGKVDVSQYDWLQFTYHSIPIRQLQKSLNMVPSSCSTEVNYQYQVEQTSMLVAERLGMASRYSVSYQSSMGEKWLKPSTDDVLANFPSRGIKRVLVISPAFVADNLETLKDIDVEVREIFMVAGGEVFTYIPCLNDNDDWARAVVGIIEAL